jgi:hypothetical protein
LRDLAAGDLQAGQLNLASFIEIEDDNRCLLMTVTLNEAVQVSGVPESET